MGHFQPTRLASIAAMVGSSLLFSGGALLLNASPAFATAGNPCNTLNATIDLSTLSVTGTVSGCKSHGSGVITIFPLDLSGGPSPGTIAWATGKATSGIVVTAQIFVGDCSASSLPIAATLTITAVGGPYAGDVGGGVICTDGINIVNATPINI